MPHPGTLANSNDSSRESEAGGLDYPLQVPPWFAAKLCKKRVAVLGLVQIVCTLVIRFVSLHCHICFQETTEFYNVALGFAHKLAAAQTWPKVILNYAIHR